jgi:hypothetical protein
MESQLVSLLPCNDYYFTASPDVSRIQMVKDALQIYGNA